MKKIKLTCGIDLSLRSTGICFVDEYQTPIEFLLHQTEKIKTDNIYEYEDLLIDNIKFFKSYIESVHYSKQFEIEEIVIEGLSFGSKSSLTDFISGHHIMLRCMIRELGIPFRIVTPTQWRRIHKIKPKGITVKELKEEYGNNYLKILAWNKLPEKVKTKIQRHIKKLELKKKFAEWDLTDAYWIACS